MSTTVWLCYIFCWHCLVLDCNFGLLDSIYTFMASTSLPSAPYKLPLTPSRPTSQLSHRVTIGLTALLLVLAPLLLAIVPETLLWLRMLALLTLTWWLPGALLVMHWRLADVDVSTTVLLALGLGFCWMVLLMLGIHWVPGPIAFWQLIIIYGIGAGALWLPLLWHQPMPLRATPRSVWPLLAGLLLVAVLVRLPGLDYHEFHVDEVVLLSRAADAIAGMDDAFARHTKGPGEIAVTTLIYRGVGTMNETTARVPFALLSIGSVMALVLLGRALFSWRVGFWAGLLLALNGFALGLSRILQYQAAVILLSVLAILAGWRFAQHGNRRWLLLTVALTTFGMVMHYEFALIGPALLMLVGMGWRRSRTKAGLVRTGLLAGSGGMALLASVYLPTIFNPYFSRTQDYLGNRLGDFASNNLAFFTEMGTFYNSTWFFVGLIALTVLGIGLGWRTARTQTWLLLLWFVPYFVLYNFIMRFPGTHYYIFMTCWSVLAALPLAALTERVQSPAEQMAGAEMTVSETPELPPAATANRPTPSTQSL